MTKYSIIELIESKSFDELSNSEKLFVLKEMSKESYTQQYNIISNAKKGYKVEFNQTEFDADFITKLNEANKKEKERFVLPFWLSRPIPAYSIALTCLVFVLLIFTFEPKTTEVIVYKNSAPKIIYNTILQKDTIYLAEKTDYSVNNNSAQKKLPVYKKEKSISISKKTTDEGEFTFNSNKVSEQKKLVGSSTINNNELAQFLGVNI